MKLKKKLCLKKQRVEKIVLPGETAQWLDHYANYYEDMYQEKIVIHDLIIEVINAFIKSDRDFQRWFKESEDSSVVSS
jgi:hypothetical protein